MITDRDIPGLRQLWQQAFGDTDSFLDKFFARAFDPRRCRCIRESGKIAAALYWFDCEYQNRKVAYLYAVATDKAFRGKGLCRNLMADTHKHLQSLGYAGAMLVPAQQPLAAMYEKFGYRRICPVEKASASIASIQTAIPLSPAEYQALRREQLGENAVLHGDVALQFLHTYGGFYKTEAGLFCGYREGDTFHFEEALGAVDRQQTAPLEAMYLPLDKALPLPGYFSIPLS